MQSDYKLIWLKEILIRVATGSSALSVSLFSPKQCCVWCLRGSYMSCNKLGPASHRTPRCEEYLKFGVSRFCDFWCSPGCWRKQKIFSSSSGQLQPGCPGNRNEKNCDYLKIERTDLRLDGKRWLRMRKTTKCCDRLLELLKVELHFSASGIHVQVSFRTQAQVSLILSIKHEKSI